MEDMEKVAMKGMLDKRKEQVAMEVANTALMTLSTSWSSSPSFFFCTATSLFTGNVGRGHRGDGHQGEEDKETKRFHKHIAFDESCT